MKTHYRKLANPDYIGAYELMTGDKPIELVVIIESVANVVVTGANNRQDECIVAKLKGHKPMILNATNCKTIAKLADSPYIEDWAGLKMTLFVAKVKAFGETMDALRIRDKAPKLPELTPDHAKWNAAVEALKNKSTTIEAIKASFSLSAENEMKIQEHEKV